MRREHLPSFYDASKVRDVYVERVALVSEAAGELANKHEVTPASHDRPRIAAFGIDCQVAFCTPGASLFVPGAVEDTTRTIEWLYANLPRITQLAFSLDTHLVFQIFHPAWWVDDEGNHPAPFTNISARDVRDSRWKPIAHPAACLEYVEQLERSGKYVLTVWPYHALLGGVSHALVPALMEAAMFHALVRQAQTRFETKGALAMTENYSVFAPEVRELGGKTVGTFNTPFFEMLMEFDRVYVFGQAKSHCVLSTLRDMQRHIERTDPGLVDKIYVLEDATSPVAAPPIDPLPPAVDFARVAGEGFAALEAAGMHIVTTRDSIR